MPCMLTCIKMAVHTYLLWGEMGEDITRLPQGWEARVAEDNRVYFVSHKDEETQWDNPDNGLRYRVKAGLPYGWQKFKDGEGVLSYVDHQSQLRSLVHPRLLSKAAYDFPDTYGIDVHSSIRNKFRSLTKASQVIKDVDMKQKVAIVTGANSGLGFQTALCLAQAGARVILACRNSLKADQAVGRILQTVPSAHVQAVQLDLSSLRSVKSFADEFLQLGLPLHVLVCNAGVFGGPFCLSEDGLEQHFAINHLGHFYLTTLLLDALRNARPSRVVVVTSESHWYPNVSSSTRLNLQALQHPNRHSYKDITAYGASKLCNLLFMLEFHHRYSDYGIACNAVHPGNFLPSNLLQRAGCLYRTAATVARVFTKSLDQGAATIVYCAAHSSMDSISGLYMYECWPAEPSPEAQDLAAARALWDLSKSIVRQKMSVQS